MVQLVFKQAKFYFGFKMTAQKAERVQVECDVISRIHTLSLQLLEKYLILCFLSSRIINNRCKECQIFLHD